jgi:P27 family predicted phage terminase small subunit
LTVLRGNPSKKPLNTNEPVVPSGDPTMPAGLSAAAVAVWAELAPICAAMRTLTAADVRTFATLCELQASFQAVTASKDGRELFRLEQQDTDDPKSPMEIVIDAALKAERDTAAALRPYYELFGLSPVARARISVPKADTPASKWERLIG